MLSTKQFVRAVSLVLGALLAHPMAVAASGAADDTDNPKWCRACHDTETHSAARMGASVHAELTCRDCHAGYHFNPHEAVHEDEDSKPIAACLECHSDVTDDNDRVAHGKGTEGAVTPFCLDCHGDPHGIQPIDSHGPIERRLAMNERCTTCHGSDDRMAAAGLNTHPVHGYEESMHSRKLLLGSERAPGCVDCHGGHEQTELPGGLVAKCKTCHESANAAFASLAGHAPISPSARPVAYYTQKFFAWLTFLTILLLAILVMLDLAASIRASSKRAEAKG